MTSNELHLLLVEDDAVDILNVQRSFRKLNLLNPMHVAYDGLEALALLRGTETTPPIPLPNTHTSRHQHASYEWSRIFA